MGEVTRMTRGRRVTCCKNLYLEEDESAELHERKQKGGPSKGKKIASEDVVE